MINSSTKDKLKILADAAKYDVSCASSGNKRKNNGRGVGNVTPWGICHSFAEDGRCVSLLKIMLSNHCIYDCAYCVNRSSNDIKRTSFTVDEITELTMEFYRRNYIEGLFLSSGVMKNADYTMERMVRVAKDLRERHRYFGYIHLKTIPGASDEQIRQAGFYADRLSVNIEIPTEDNLKLLAPQKDYKTILSPMNSINTKILENKSDRKKYRKTPKFSPAGQSTQLIIGATPDTDQKILSLATNLYQANNLKRVYYSGYLPINQDSRLPALKEPPLKREHRLYQADWLYRFYFFSVNEIVNDSHPNLDLEVDPKLGYALRNPSIFPIDINKADYEMILRIPGVGPMSAQKIVLARKYHKLNSSHLKKIGVVLKRAQYFITCNELKPVTVNELKPEYVKKILTMENKPARIKPKSSYVQLSLFND